MARKKGAAHLLTDRIWSERKRLEVFEVLSAVNPPHFRKVWLVGFLRYAVGFTEEEVFQVIMAGNWEKKNPAITRYQIASVKKEGATQKAIRTKNVESGNKSAGDSLPVSSPVLGKDNWRGIVNSAGFTLEWIRV